MRFVNSYMVVTTNGNISNQLHEAQKKKKKNDHAFKICKFVRNKF